MLQRWTGGRRKERRGIEREGEREGEGEDEEEE